MSRTVFLSCLGVCSALALIGPAGRGTRASPPAAPHASRLAGVQGEGASGVLFQNLDAAQMATMEVDLHHLSGDPPVKITRPQEPKGKAAALYLPAEPQLRAGVYAAIASADRDIGMLVRSDWGNTGAAVMANEALAGTDIVVPYVVKGHQGQVSLIAIQNTDPDTEATAILRFFAAGQTVPLSTASMTIPAGTSVLRDLMVDPAFATVPVGTVGYARIQSDTAIAAQSLVDVEASAKAVFDVEGMPVEQAAGTLHAPLIHAGVIGYTGAEDIRLDTFISVVNVTASPVEVDVVYAGVAGSCRGQAYRHPAITLAGHAGAVITQAPGQSLPGTGASPLPPRCTATATLVSTGGPILATVVGASAQGALAQGYAALNPSRGDTTVHLPLFRRRHSTMEITTAVHVMNQGSQDATVSLQISDHLDNPLGDCFGCTVTLAPGAGTRWWPGDIAELADNMFGSAMIVADQPVGAVVIEVSLQALDLSSYVGLGQGGSGKAPGAARKRSYAPLVINRALIRSPGGMVTPTSSRPPIPTSTAGPPPLLTPQGFIPSLLRQP